MGCSNCSIETDGAPAGCGNKGSCSTGGCNKLNTYDWLSHIDLPDYGNYDLVEVSFKNGSRKEIFRKPDFVYIATGDHVVVESAAGGYDIGQVALMGELMQIQLKKYRIKDTQILPNILRQANERDLERLAEARAAEKEAMIQARIIVRDLNLDMKIGDVEYQGDKRKITFYYTADGRVDFRELIRIFAKEYKVKIEMRQIGARQESARIGGIGSCGRELCCSTWLTDFKSVSTVAARYQNLAINQSKLSGQCGRLKCCLNYELNTYLEALQDFPKNVNSIKTKKGNAVLIKTDIFKRSMYFAYRTEFGIADIQQLSVEQVKELHSQNQQGVLPEDLGDVKTTNNFTPKKEEDLGFIDGAGSLELKQLDKKKKKKKSKGNRDLDNNRDRKVQNTSQDSTKEINKESKDLNRKDNNHKKPQNNQNQHVKKNQPPVDKVQDGAKETVKSQNPETENKTAQPNHKHNHPKKEGHQQNNPKGHQHKKPKPENKVENKVVADVEKVVTDNAVTVVDNANPKPNNSNKNRNRNRNRNRNHGKNKNPNPNNNVNNQPPKE